MDWLHYVGKSFYTQPQFIKEAEQYGVSRRVSIRVLTGMNWNDRVWVAQGDMKQKRRVTPTRGAEVFGSFRVQKLSGLSKTAIEALRRHDVKLTSVPVAFKDVVRECGEYTVDACYQLTTPLPEIARILAEETSLGVDIGTLLLQGQFKMLEPIAGLPDCTFQWGFRHFDGVSFALSHKQLKLLPEFETKVVILSAFKITADESKKPAKPKTKPEVEQLARYVYRDLWS